MSQRNVSPGRNAPATNLLADQAPKSAAPFPVVADTPGRPYLRPHRMAHATRDQEMIEALGAPVRHITSDRYEGVADRVRSWVITIALTLMGAALLFTAIDAYFDRVL